MGRMKKIRLVDTEWDIELSKALLADASELRIICPFIKAKALHRLLSHQPCDVQVITRFSLTDIAVGVSDVAALRKLLNVGARIRGVRNLHAKLYLFGSTRVILTSANLTDAALTRNHEFGMVTEDAKIIAACRTYFDGLWQRCGPDLQHHQIDDWDKTLTRYRVLGGRPNRPIGLDDFGADAGISDPPPVQVPAVVVDATQAFVKFLGNANNRVPLSCPTIEQIKHEGCHWAVCYPASKRPRAVKDNAVIFIGRLVLDPNDIRVFGRAIGMRHEPGRDDATPDDIARREWKKDWPRYIRVHHAEFVEGTMENGVSLNKLMKTLGSTSFSSTKRNAARGEGNTDPRKAYKQQSAVELSSEGLMWLSEELQAAFDTHGKIPQYTLDKLDWPDLPISLSSDNNEL